MVKQNCRALECVLKKTDDTLYMNEILILWFIVYSVELSFVHNVLCMLNQFSGDTFSIGSSDS